MTKMFKIALPDGSVREVAEGSTPADVAAAIGPGLAKAALAARVDGELRDLLVARLLTPLTRLTGGDRPELRASLVGAQMAGLAFARYIVGLPRLAAATPEELIGALTPVLQHYLTGDLSPASP